MEPTRIQTMTITLSLSEAKAKLSEIADGIARTHERVIVTKNGRNHIVLISNEELESIEATLELLRDPQEQAEVIKAEEDFAAGNIVTLEEMMELMEARRASGV